VIGTSQRRRVSNRPDLQSIITSEEAASNAAQVAGRQQFIPSPFLRITVVHRSGQDGGVEASGIASAGFIRPRKLNSNFTSREAARKIWPGSDDGRAR